MAPTVRKPLTLGFIGRGATGAKNVAALLSDLIEADAGKAKIILPATEAHWTEGIEAVADFALENKYPLVLVTDDSTAEQKNLKGYVQQATEKIKVVNPVNKVVKLTAEGSGKLIMLWDDEDDDCYTALELAESESVEALDLTAGLHKLEFTGEQQSQEDEPEDDGDQSEEPAEDESQEDDLDDMDEAELQDMAESLGLDVEAYDEWEDVRIAIREIRAQETEDEDDVAADDDGIPSPDAVLEWDFETLKKYAQDNGIEVPPRSKTAGYRTAIVSWLETVAEKVAALDQEEEDLLSLPQDDENIPGAIIDMTPVKEEIESLRADIESVAKRVDAVGRSLSEHMIEMRTLVMEVTKPGTIQAAQQKATQAAQEGQAAQTAEKTHTVARKPAKAAQKPAKAAPAKRTVNRPATKPSPTDEVPERPLAPFMHLLGKKLTKAQAKEIVIAAAMRGRGRPTEDERALIAAARELVPQT